MSTSKLKPGFQNNFIWLNEVKFCNQDLIVECPKDVSPQTRRRPLFFINLWRPLLQQTYIGDIDVQFTPIDNDTFLMISCRRGAWNNNHRTGSISNVDKRINSFSAGNVLHKRNVWTCSRCFHCWHSLPVYQHIRNYLTFINWLKREFGSYKTV